MRIVAEHLAGFGDIGVGDFDVAGLEWFLFDSRRLADGRGYELDEFAKGGGVAFTQM